MTENHTQGVATHGATWWAVALEPLKIYQRERHRINTVARTPRVCFNKYFIYLPISFGKGPKIHRKKDLICHEYVMNMNF